MPARYIALVPAAGTGNRMQSAVPKQYLPLGEKPMLQIVLDTLMATGAIDHVYLIVAADDSHIDALLGANRPPKLTVLRCGGATRQQTVLNGLQAIGNQVDTLDWILVHDAARPGLTSAMVEHLIAEVGNDPVGGILAVPMADTVKRGIDQRITQTIERSQLWSAQTPQMFRHALLQRALQSATDCTDEASAVEALGLQSLLVEGSIFNFKVTRPDDAALATLVLKGRR